MSYVIKPSDQYAELTTNDLRHTSGFADSTTAAKRNSCLSWKNVSYSIKKKRNETKTLISNMYGSVRAGEVIAIMGASGTGKSTLLNTLAGRVGPGELTGEILINGKPRNPADWRLMCSYVEQDDVLYPNFTVHETLLFTAMLRLPSSMSRSEKLTRVENVIEELGLEECRDTRIGSPERKGISGGERKRLSIGIELVSDPHILFLDEPTSGLDSFNALNIMNVLRDRATKDGTLILLTIHQPRNDILDMFDKIILLSEGRPLWFGPIGAAMSHFESLGYHIPPRTSPADFFLDISSIDNRSDELKEKSLERILSFIGLYEHIREREGHGNEHAEEQHGRQSMMQIQRLIWPSTRVNEILTLLKRNFLDLTRNWGILITAIAQVIVSLGIFIGSYNGIGTNAASITRRDTMFFLLCLVQTIANVMPYVATFPRDRMVIKRERSSGSYRSSSNFYGRFLSILPVTLMTTILFCAPSYWIIGLNSHITRFLMFAVIMFVHNVTSTAMSLFISSLSPSIRAGQIVAPFLIFVLAFFSMDIVELVPKGYEFLRWISPSTYTQKAFLLNEFDDSSLIFVTRQEFRLDDFFQPGETKPGSEIVMKFFSGGSITRNAWVYLLVELGMMVVFLVLGQNALNWTSAPLLRLRTVIGRTSR